jgi:hypothetical protein
MRRDNHRTVTSTAAAVLNQHLSTGDAYGACAPPPEPDLSASFAQATKPADFAVATLTHRLSSG